MEYHGAFVLHTVRLASGSARAVLAAARGPVPGRHAGGGLRGAGITPTLLVGDHAVTSAPALTPGLPGRGGRDQIVGDDRPD